MVVHIILSLAKRHTFDVTAVGRSFIYSRNSDGFRSRQGDHLSAVEEEISCPVDERSIYATLLQ